MAITWTKDLSVGVDMIDKQHQTLFKMADDLFEAGKKGNAKEKIPELLGFLEDYTKTHFHDEEVYMQKINYPEYQNQKKYHDAFINELIKLRKDFEQSGGNVLLIINANSMVVNWLTQHISIQDKKIGQYAKSLENK